MKKNKKNKSFLKKTADFIRSPIMTLVIGATLFVAGILELTETLLEKYLDIEIKAVHGVMVFGMYQILLSIVHIISGIESIELSLEEKHIEEEIDLVEEKINKENNET